jgi:hypothetical protein
MMGFSLLYRFTFTCKSGIIIALRKKGDKSMFRNHFGLSAGITIIIVCTLIICGAYSHSNAQDPSIEKSGSEKGAKVAADRIPNTLTGEHGHMKVDLRKSYEEELKKMGVSDFSTENLISILDGNEVLTKKQFVACLFGERNEVNAMPALERALGDESDYVKIAAAEALLKMGNKKAIPVLEKICVEYSKEYEEGNLKNLSHLKCAAVDLAGAGEVSAIPYLRQIAADPNLWTNRLTALGAFSKLADKDPNVIIDINRMKNDENPQVQKEATVLMKMIEAKKQ